MNPPRDVQVGGSKTAVASPAERFGFCAVLVG